MATSTDHFRLHHLRRQTHLKKEIEQKRQRILAVLPNVALIVQQFGAKQVVIFGSVLNEKKFHARSDLDILVVGMPLAGWLPALLGLEQIPELSDVVIDLKRAEELPEGLVSLILNQGQRITPEDVGQ